MKSKLLLCLALVLSGGLFGCATGQREDRLLSFNHAQLGSTYEIGVYVIGKGDSVAKICKQFQISIPDFMALNPGLDWRRLRIGRTVRVYERLNR